MQAGGLWAWLLLGVMYPAIPPPCFPEKSMVQEVASCTSSLVTHDSVNSCVSLLA